MKPTEELVAAALEKVDSPYGEDVVDAVLGIIENDSNLLAEYWNICAEFSQKEKDMNPNVSYFVMKLTEGRTSTGGHTCKKNTLAKTYSKMKY